MDMMMMMMFDFFLVFGFTARQNYFTHVDPVNHKVGRKREIPEKKHLTTASRTWLVSQAQTRGGEMTSD